MVLLAFTLSKAFPNETSLDLGDAAVVIEDKGKDPLDSNDVHPRLLSDNVPRSVDDVLSVNLILHSTLDERPVNRLASLFDCFDVGHSL